jgi:AcrR family transcriptional regulator
MSSSSTQSAGSLPRPRRRARGSLNPEVISAAAFRVAERDGLEGVTFQALGVELGAHPTAIYRHFRSKDELLLALVDTLHAEALAELAPATDDWAADLRAVSLKTHEVFVRHPSIGQLAVRTARREHEFKIVERVVDCILRGGLPPREAARHYRVFMDFVLAYSAIDAELAALPADVRDADLRSWEVEYRTLPADQYPRIDSIAGHLPRLDDPQNFALALDLMIEAIRQAARRMQDSPA